MSAAPSIVNSIFIVPRESPVIEYTLNGASLTYDPVSNTINSYIPASYHPTYLQYYYSLLYETSLAPFVNGLYVNFQHGINNLGEPDGSSSSSSRLVGNRYGIWTMYQNSTIIARIYIPVAWEEGK